MLGTIMHLVSTVGYGTGLWITLRGGAATAMQRLCRTYGARDYFGMDSQTFRSGLAYAAPTALMLDVAR